MMRRVEFTAAAAAFGFGATVALSRGASIAGVPDRIDDLVGRAMQELPIRAVSLVAARDGRPVAARAYGIAELPSGAAATVDTVYPVGSITKTLTAAAVFALRERGRVDLDVPVARFVPDAPHGKRILVRWLLQQRSGLPDIYGDFAWELRMRSATAEQMIDLVRERPLRFVPGSQFEYSNTNYLVLGRLVERVTGLSYAAAMRRLVLEPVGLKRTGLVGERLGQRATGYQRQTNPEGAPIDIPDGARMYWGAGGLASSASDLARWDAAFVAGRLLHPASVVEMESVPPENAPARYASGFFVGTFGGETRLRHGGNVPGFSCTNDIFPRQRLSISVLCNLSRIDIESLADRIGAALLGSPQPRGPIFN